MTDSTFQLLAIGLYFAAMIAIGVYAYRQTNDLDDYMLAGRKLSPGVAALSAGLAIARNGVRAGAWGRERSDQSGTSVWLRI